MRNLHLTAGEGGAPAVRSPRTEPHNVRSAAHLSCSRTILQKGEASYDQSSRGASGAFDGRARPPADPAGSSPRPFVTAASAPFLSGKGIWSAPGPYDSKRYAMMSSDSYFFGPAARQSSAPRRGRPPSLTIALPVLGSSMYGNICFPPFWIASGR